MLIYFMLQNELPFGSWRESDLDIFAKIAKGQLMFPSHFSVEVIDLLKKVSPCLFSFLVKTWGIMLMILIGNNNKIDCTEDYPLVIVDSYCKLTRI